MLETTFPRENWQCIEQMKAGSRHADEAPFQTGAYSYMHAVRQKGQPVAAASAQVWKYVDSPRASSLWDHIFDCLLHQLASRRSYLAWHSEGIDGKSRLGKRPDWLLWNVWPGSPTIQVRDVANDPQGKLAPI